MVHKFYYLITLAIVFITSQLFAQVTVQFTNPWPDEPERADSLKVTYYTAATGYKEYPAVSEGFGLYSYTFTTQSNTSDLGFSIKSYSSAGNKEIKDLNIKNLFKNDEVATDVYLYYITQGSEPEITFNPPKSKVIYLLNPWPQNSPKAVVNGSTKAVQMRTHELKEQDENFCGWYSFFYNGDVSKCLLHFVNYPETQKYLTGGINSGDDYDLSSYLKDYDTIWIRPNPYSSGPGVISSSYPNKRGDCGFRTISAHVRDFKSDGISFFIPFTKDGQNVVKNIVQSTLGSNGKPVKSATTPAGATGVETVNDWFTDSHPDTCVQLKLSKLYNGNWVFNSDKDGGFFPIDDFNPYNETFTDPKGGSAHNFHFSMELHASFAYAKGTKQQFIFRGDDDVWIFINNKLAIDLGNLHYHLAPNSTDTVNLDQDAGTLGLQDGSKYQIDMFYMERQPYGSNFYMNTSLDLYNEEQLMINPDTLSKEPLKIQYNATMWEKKSAEGGCGINLFNDSIVDAEVDCSIEGPQWPSGEKKALVKGLNYKGITIPDKGTYVIIDTANTKDLKYGVYTITFVSRKNNELQYALQFQVGGIRPVIISANPISGTHYFGDTIVDLSTSPSDENKIQLYYKLSSKANLTASTSDTPYTYGKSLTIIPFPGSDTTYLDVISIETKDFFADTVKFKYIRDKVQSTLEASPPSGTHFGETLDVTLTTNADSIYYTLNGLAPQPGKSGTTAGGKSVKISIVGETVVKALASGSNFIEQKTDFTYFSDKVPNISATPENLYFINEVQVTLSVNQPGAEIYYTLNGDIPSKTDKLYNGSILLGSTTTIKARAFSDNKVPSIVFERTYYRQAIVTSALYLDTSGDGFIDRAVISFDTAMSIPDTILLVNPYSTRDTQKVQSGSISVLSQTSNSYTLSVKLSRQFESNKTSFSADKYGSVRGGFNFFRDPFTISDGVAPIIQKALLIQGAMIRKEPFETEKDTLEINFSENVKGLKDGQQFTLRQKSSEYSFDLRFLNVNNERARYTIESINPSSINPQPGDSIWINPQAGISDINDNVRDFYNRPVKLEIKPRPIVVNFSAVTLFSPLTKKIKVNSKGEQVYSDIDIPFEYGTTILVDFTVPLYSAVSDIKMQCVIYDNQGNAVSRCLEIGEKNKTMAAVLRKTSTTQIVIAWNGCNLDGRVVGIGTYLAVVKVKVPSGGWVSKNINIGVKRD
jgi:fibro-slime domain-containing protein